MTVEISNHQPGDHLESELVARGVPAPQAHDWAQVGGAQVLRLSSTTDHRGQAVFLWEAHREPSQQLTLRSWTTTGATSDAGAALQTLVEEALNHAKRLNYPLIKAQSFPQDSLLAAVVAELGFTRIAAPESALSLGNESPIPDGWVRHLAAEPVVDSPRYIRQRTDFTCGPASLMMGAPQLGGDLDTEISLWREATYVVGSDPYGLAGALGKRGVSSSVFVSSSNPMPQGPNSGALITGAVRDAFQRLNLSAAQTYGATLVENPPTLSELRSLVDDGYRVAVLIDEQALNGESCAHWVLVWGAGPGIFYLHDPWTDENLGESWVESWSIPCTDEALWEMASWGEDGSRAFVAIAPQHKER